MPTEPTPKDPIHRDGTAQIYRFRRPEAPGEGPVVLLIPSLINRWYILDLHKNASVVQAFLDAGFDTYCLDWGIPEDEDRYLSWDLVLDRLGRAVRKVKRFSGEEDVGLLGYCMGGTLTGIWTALHPEEVPAFCNLAGPFDFDEAGLLGTMTNPKWFDAEAISDAGNVAAQQMQSGFIALRPTSQISKWISLADRADNPVFRMAFKALDTWANDNIPFPAAAYRTYIEELYQENLLVKGEHYAQGRRVDLGDITCPVLTVATSRDHICPEPAARGLHDHVGSEDREMFVVRGGHVGAVVGSRAPKTLYPKITTWFAEKLAGATRLREVEAAPEPQDPIERLAGVKHVGDWVAMQAHENLGVETIADLIEAAEAGRLQEIRGIGPKKEKQILEAAREQLEEEPAAE